MKLSISRFDNERDSREWDALCRAAPMATFLHTRAFLSYHGDRFEDASRVLRDERGLMIAVLPAARQPGQSDTVCTHPGASFGGLVHAGDLLGEDLIKALAMICMDYRGSGFSSLRYKLTPHIYHRWPADDDRYALWRLGAGATQYRCDLSSAIDLAARGTPNSRRRRALRNAQTAALTIHDDTTKLESFWHVLAANLAERHDAKPVHSLQEIQLLAGRFPDEIALLTAQVSGNIEAGVLLFLSARVCHAQYIACSAAGRAVNALDALFEQGIHKAHQLGCRYFDFGISNEDEGRHLNTGLYQFKSEFGGGGVAHAFYDLPLDAKLAESCDAILKN
ncbi:MAG: family N-acetyltransferase [Rhodocyclales bacterium]|nr:family N-acetyltransferase [Rhodocyclales bacterium]